MNNSSHASSKRLPGEEGVWMFVLGDLVVFTLFFSTFLLYRGNELEAYREASASLSVFIGAANTIALLTSSWLIVMAVKLFRTGSAQTARRLVVGAIVLGLVFLLGKSFEYAGKSLDGIADTEAEFFMFYFVFTGIHFVHVLVGLALLALVMLPNHLQDNPEAVSESRLRVIEASAIYWHMVDVLWVILFTLFYLLG